ncbi:DNA-binding LacI/PurR family transcriptional regulator [Cellulosimicrobium cellulans]|uniref:LacI family DNA-binding transcriptional regulator n=1 Tax=Cellulosimicrobium cellulans TaxID=1710 RepID=UPI00142F8062|nr:LacI family DNA-binding transcriptional regulator [Cellulosimicrobium cellulans]MBM7819425.1 DNA-binding LacI/PurR family transcriptional regulator [Cellulosimicrobium cellulans]
MTTNSSPGPASHGAVGPSARRITITDVARAAGVSIAVVSYALNGRPGVSERTRRHVLRTAADLGWRPSAAARSLRSSARSVALQVVHAAEGAAGPNRALALAAGMRAVLTEHDLALGLEVTDDRDEGARELEAGWSERRHAAYVVVDAHARDPRIRAAREAVIPLVEVTPGPSDPATPGVRTWFAGDADARAARYLVELGHRRIAVLVSDAQDELARTLVAAARDAGGPETRVDVVECRTWEETRSRAARLVAHDSRPTAVLTDTDVAALAVLEAGRGQGLEVPWDLSVLSGEDSATCRLVAPALTAVHRPFQRLGAHVADVVVARLGLGRPVARPDADPATTRPAVDRERPAARLLLRGTTAPPRGA